MNFLKCILKVKFIRWKLFTFFTFFIACITQQTCVSVINIVCCNFSAVFFFTKKSWISLARNPVRHYQVYTTTTHYFVYYLSHLNKHYYLNDKNMIFKKDNKTTTIEYNWLQKVITQWHQHICNSTDYKKKNQ